MSEILRSVGRFREFPLGTTSAPSMREFMSDAPWPNQDKVLEYLRSGVVLNVPVGASLTDWFDRTHKVSPVINGQIANGMTEMTDGVWCWYAGLIYFIETYNVRVSPEFVSHAEKNNWHSDKQSVRSDPDDFVYSEL